MERNTMPSILDEVRRIGGLLSSEPNYSQSGGEYNPYRDYRVSEWYDDLKPYLNDEVQGADEHYKYYDQLPQLIKRLDPSQDVTKIDRGLMDMVMNYMGGYDMAARSPENPQQIQALAKAYQYRDYGDRPNDSIGDFWENMAGINAYDSERGRVTDQELYNMATKYAQERLNKGEGQQYHNYGNEYLGLLDRTAPYLAGIPKRAFDVILNALEKR